MTDDFHGYRYKQVFGNEVRKSIYLNPDWVYIEYGEKGCSDKYECWLPATTTKTDVGIPYPDDSQQATLTPLYLMKGARHYKYLSAYSYFGRARKYEYEYSVASRINKSLVRQLHLHPDYALLHCIGKQEKLEFLNHHMVLKSFLSDLFCSHERTPDGISLISYDCYFAWNGTLAGQGKVYIIIVCVSNRLSKDIKISVSNLLHSCFRVEWT